MPADPTEVDEPSNLDEWIDHIDVTADLLQDLLPKDIVLDHSPESLYPLEGSIQASRFDAMGSSFTGAVAAYLGQTLRKVAGGRWDWDGTPGSPTVGQPLVFADEVLGLPPVAPVDLVEQSGADLFEQTYTVWMRAALDHAAAHPGWQPIRQHTPGLDPVAPEPSESERLAAWLVERDREFGNWVARFGAEHTWDFTPDSVDALARQMYRITPTLEQFKDPANAAFAEGALWYVGEILRRKVPSHWGTRHGGAAPKDFDVTQDSDGSLSWAPAVMLRVPLRDGHPLRLLSLIESWVPRKVPAAIPPLTECVWTGTAWRTPSQVWQHGCASRLETLRDVGIPLDHSADSLRRFEELLLDADPDPELDTAVAVYLGETVLRVGGGGWSGPAVATDGSGLIGVGTIDLVQLARRWRDGVTFTRVYSAWERRDRELRARNRNWRPVKSPTPGLDPAPAPRMMETWCAEREREFPDWVARYGADHTWDFSRASLAALTSVIFDVTPTRGQLRSPDNATFTAGVLWYFGEVLRRARPSGWGYVEESLPDPPRCFRVVMLDSYDPMQVSGHLRPSENPAFIIDLMLDRNERDLLDNTYCAWANGSRADRAKKAMDRRERKKSRHKQSDSDHLASWLSDREREFPEWIDRFGPGHTWDFSPESLDTLEDLVLDITPLPEQLFEDEAYTDLLDGAAWYFGEVFRQALPLQWYYDRKAGIDCYLTSAPGGPGYRSPIQDLADIFLRYDRGVLRRKFGR